MRRNAEDTCLTALLVLMAATRLARSADLPPGAAPATGNSGP